ncbi:hypothetical protein GCM10011608_06210 [Micromonospora sonchi]|uniref:Uncharacterized protein n=1 Tax=Micromonospora sonchi TaxID=1763543 RepID=A0A917TI70_9ACTN|nr:hypothetical protein GCM10011608_06210 [Micromonospora sonchi]
MTVLRREFESVDGSFLLRLRGGLVWDRAAFSRLEQAMRLACEQRGGHDDLPRWMAEGFYEVSHFVAEWTAHPNFPRRSRRSTTRIAWSGAGSGGLVLSRVACLPGAAPVA